MVQKEGESHLVCVYCESNFCYCESNFAFVNQACYCYGPVTGVKITDSRDTAFGDCHKITVNLVSPDDRSSRARD